MANSKKRLGARHLSLELLANSKNNLELGITPKSINNELVSKP